MKKLFDGVVCEENLDNLKALIFELFPLLKNFLEDKSENVVILNKTTVGIYDYFDFIVDIILLFLSSLCVLI